MKTKLNRTCQTIIVCSVALLASVSPSDAQGTAFTYQGRLQDGGSPANGSYDLAFTLFDAETDGTAIAGPLDLPATAVSNGLFTVSLDFGGQFDGGPRYLEIQVNTNGGDTPVILSPRQQLTPAPYAIFAQNASGVAGGAVVQSLNGLKDDVTLVAGANVTITPNGNTLTIDAAGAGGGGIWSVNNNNAYYNAGNVGIGTDSPQTKLAVRTGTGYYGFTHTDGTTSVGSYVGGSSSGAAGGWLGTLSADPLHLFVGGGQPSLTIDTTGNVGIGTHTPAEKLTIAGVTGIDNGLKVTGIGLNGVGMAIENTYPGGHKYALVSGDFYIVPPGIPAGAGDFRIVDETANVGDRFVIAANGNVGINIANPQATLDVNGTTRTSVLTITGGADLAEPFPLSSEYIPAGSVVVIDEEHPGQLKPSTAPYDTRVAGIVSGANGIHPGISLQQAGALAGGQNVALTGRVYALADADSASIHPGDLLTTSCTPGHAMKVTDHGKGQGAILGKAMSSLETGKGLVLVLVTLQ